MSTHTEEQTTTDAPEIQRITLNLPRRTVEGIVWVASKFGISRTQMIRQSVDLRVHLQQEVDSGARVLIERDGAVREIIFN